MNFKIGREPGLCLEWKWNQEKNSSREDVITRPTSSLLMSINNQCRNINARDRVKAEKGRLDPPAILNSLDFKTCSPLAVTA